MSDPPNANVDVTGGTHLASFPSNLNGDLTNVIQNLNGESHVEIEAGSTVEETGGDKKARVPRKPKPRSEIKTKALEELKNALALASIASRQMELGKEQLTVKELAELMHNAQVAKLNEAALPDYKGFGFYHKSGKKIRYYSLTTAGAGKRTYGNDQNKAKKRKLVASKGLQGIPNEQAHTQGSGVGEPHFEDAASESVYHHHHQHAADEVVGHDVVHDGVHDQVYQHPHQVGGVHGGPLNPIIYQQHMIQGQPQHGFPQHPIQFMEQYPGVEQ